MWISLIIAVLTFVMQKSSGASDKKALGAAALAGGATYLATEYTDWGREASQSFDEWLGVGGNSGNPAASETVETITGYDAEGKPIRTTVTRPSTSAAQGGSGTGLGSAAAGLWSSLGPVGQAATVVTGGVVANNFLSKYGLWILGGVAVYLITQD